MAEDCDQVTSTIIAQASQKAVRAHFTNTDVTLSEESLWARRKLRWHTHMDKKSSQPIERKILLQGFTSALSSAGIMAGEHQSIQKPDQGL
eukprot:c30435_g1_i1 orf=162-434(+)